MKKITDIHYLLSIKNYLCLLWLLYKYGDLQVGDVLELFAPNANRFTYITNQLSEAGLIEMIKDPNDGRQKIIRLKKDFAAIYSYTMFHVSTEPEMLEIEKKFLEKRGK